MKKDYSLDEKNVLKNFGSNLKRLRKDAGLSQEKIALKCCLDRTYIGSVERGERNISLINIKKLAVSLGVNLEELLNKI
jgi:transcriptional regulator with XRE-family HTH domain